MHRAPSVSYPVGRSIIAAGLGAALLVLAGLALLLWWLSAPGPRWGQGLAVALWLASAAQLACLLHTQPCGVLHWDGQHWSLLPGERSGLPTLEPLRGELELKLDAQLFMAMTLRPQPGRPLWLWVQQDAHPSRWLDLRRAVYDRRVL